MRDQKPLMDSTIMHELMALALDNVNVTKEGDLFLEPIIDTKHYRK